MNLDIRGLIGGGAENHLLPFVWMHSGQGAEGSRAMVRAAKQSGCGAVCVESRPHEHFCEDEWWRDMDALLDEAEKLGMKVWILDDKHFPTGYANGLVTKKYPERRKWHLCCPFVDGIGPMAGASFLPPHMDGEDSIYAVIAAKRDEKGLLTGERMDVTDRMRGGRLYIDLPAGVWRIFFVIHTRKGAAKPEYIHMIDPQSVDTLIEGVYEPHYEHYKDKFGKTIAGFFSDEPEFGNAQSPWYRGRDVGFYDARIGERGLALPWTEDILCRMETELGEKAVTLLPLLWQEGEDQERVRLAYMNAVTLAWRDAFSRKVGGWCRERGVMYIGHIIEDMNAHGHLGCSGGHYFRSLEGQDMSGIDVVLHQIMPGLGQVDHAAICYGGLVDSVFFDYTLAKLAASAAHLEKRKRGRAMCEVFGAYGWAEGTPFMRFLMDHMLVRGINYFVPHAFSSIYPDPDCPPQFFAGGNNPQFPGFKRLMDYSNFAADILTGGTHRAQAAILYHAEAEWSGRDWEYVQAPARALYDRQIDYDIAPLDMAKDAVVEDGKIRIGGQTFQALVVPGCRYLPKGCLDHLAGANILFCDYKPEDMPGDVVPRERLAERFDREVVPEPEWPLLRVYHAAQNGRDVYMLVNESVADPFDGTVRLTARGEYVYLQKQLEYFASAETEDGRVPLRLEPGESAILVFGSREGLPQRERAEKGREMNIKWRVSRASHESLLGLTPEPGVDPADQQSRAARFEPLCETEALFDLTGPEAPGDEGFSGIARYEADVDLTGVDGLDLGEVGQTARLMIDGKDMGLRFTAPYRFDLRGVEKGTRHVTIEVANTLTHAIPDPFSRFMQVPRSGLLGPVREVEYKEIG